MGLNTSIAKLLVRARLHGVSFARTGTIGRQSLAIPKKDLRFRCRATIAKSGSRRTLHRRKSTKPSSPSGI